MKKLASSFLATLALATAFEASAWGHSGGTDRNGCHRERATGTRHCH